MKMSYDILSIKFNREIILFPFHIQFFVTAE